MAAPLGRASPGDGPGGHETTVIARHLRTGNDVIRCAAAQALAAAGDRAAAAPVLIDALLDEDADVRTDAMAALVSCAGPKDADVIRRSLMGDPVKDVKISAIQALAQIGDDASIPLLRSLARDRCDHDVAWEDEAGMWDDWLDVQVAAIRALGAMGAVDAIGDLLEARLDIMGQDLDHVVFAALAVMPKAGIETLIDFLRDPHERVRERAMAALSRARGDLLAPLADILARDASPDVRRLAVGGMAPDSAGASALALDDPDAAVRRAALAAFAPRRNDIAAAALADEDEAARAIVLEAMMVSPAPADVRGLAENVEAWMRAAGPRLATVCAEILPRLLGDVAEEPLTRLAGDPSRPLEARIAAIRSLGGIASPDVLEGLLERLGDPIQQVRLSSLAALLDLARNASKDVREAARNALAAAISGDCSDVAAPPPMAEAGASAAAPKSEDAASAPIRITPEGEIVPADQPREPDDPAPEAEANRFPTSTLEAIQAPVTDLSGEPGEPLSSDELAHLAESNRTHRRRRVAVDGPDDIGLDIRLIALRVAADCPGREVEQALASAAAGANGALRTAAFAAIARRAEASALSDDLLAICCGALDDHDSANRGYAAQAVALGHDDAATLLAPHLEDADAIMRAHAMGAVAAARPARAADGLADPSSLVRLAALDGLLEHGAAADLERGLILGLDKGFTDCLMEAVRRSAAARAFLISILAQPDPPPRRVLVALQALA